jgi:methylmalonyl-CoA mutase
MDAAIAAAAAGAPVTDLARRTWADEPVPTARMRLTPDALVFETLRDAADRAETAPAAFAATWGALAEYKARLAWARNLFAAGGVRLVSSDATDAATVADAFAASGHRLAVLTASDARFAESGPAVVAALREAGASEVWVAGRATDVLRDAGVDRFVHLGVDVVDALEAAHRCIGVSA